MIGIFVLIIAQWSHSFHTRLSPRPGPEFWPAHQVLIRSPGCPDQIFFLNQNNVILVKKKNKSQPGRRVTPGFFFSYFFQPSLTPAPSPGSPRWAEFQNYKWSNVYQYIYIYIYIYIYEILLVNHIFSHTNKRRNKNKAYMQ